MSEKVILQLRDIIELHAPTNMNYHNKKYLVESIDNGKIVLVSEDDASEETLYVDETTNQLREESIDSINILSHDERIGYARQNGLLPDTWVDVYFGGDVPVTITGRISNLEEDMIEIKTYPDDELIYIDFAYNSIPEDLPIDKILIREKPETYSKMDDDMGMDEVSMEMGEVSMETVIPQQEVSKEEIANRLNDIILDADQIQFGETLGTFMEKVSVSEGEKRFSLEKQTGDLLDEMLSTIPNSERTRVVLNNIHTMIERFVQLREEFSQFDVNGNANMPLKKGHLYKPLVESLYNLNDNLLWVLPVVKNRKKLYNVDWDDATLQSDVLPMTIDEALLDQYNLRQEYLTRSINYTTYMNRLHGSLTPFTQPLSEENVIIEKEVLSNMTSVINNLSDFYSSVAKGNEVVRRKYIIEKYNLGLKTAAVKGDHGDLYQLTPNDKMSIKGMLFMPKPTITYSRIVLPATNIMNKSNLNLHSTNYWKILKKKGSIASEMITDLNVDSTNAPPSFTMVQPKEFSLDESIIMSPEEKYMSFLNKIVPSTRALFNAEKSNLVNSLSLYNILQSLEPYLIYHKDITYKQYEDMRDYLYDIIKKYKARHIEMNKEFNLYENKIMNLTRMQSQCLLYAILQNDDTLDKEVFEAYNYQHGCFMKSNIAVQLNSSEVLKNMLLADYGKTYMSAIAKSNEDLILPFEFNKILDQETNKANDNLKKDTNKNKCKDYVLAKRYIDITDLEEDNDISIYFDKKYDPTFYDIINEYKVQQDELDDTEFMEFLTNEIMKNIGLTKGNAQFEATSMINGSREVRNGEYAVLEIIDDDNINQTYYKREDGNWITDEDISKPGIISDPDFFCNVQEKCIEMKKTCADTNMAGSMVRSQLIKDMYEEFELDVMKNRDELIKKIDDDFNYDLQNLSTVLKIKEYQLMKYNRQKLAIESELEADDVEEISPYVRLRDYILGQGDLVKRKQDILLFTARLTRSSEPLSDESPYWLYCKKTNTKLLPSFIPVMAQALNFESAIEYQRVIDEICKERGAISDDGNKWVDKHSGYTIVIQSLDSDEGYGEGGFKNQSRDILEDEMGQALLQAAMAKNATKRLDPLSNMVNNVISSMGRYLGIQVEDMRGYIITNVVIQMKTIKSRDAYEKEAAKYKEQKKKDKDSYEIYYNQRLILITLVYLFFSIQTSIPSVRTKKSHPGCVKSFSGAPLDGDDDISGITYIACTAHRIKSSVEPWNGINKMKETTIAANIKMILDTFITASSDLKSRLEQKREYLLINEQEEIPAKLDIKRWINFLPPLVKLEIKTPQPLTSAFKNSLVESIKKGTKKQVEDALVVKSKIISFSIAIQHGIQSVVSKEKAILSSNTGPYVQNTCCYSKNMTPMEYMVSRNKNIENYNNITIELQKIVADLRTLGNAPFLFDPRNTRMVYPELYQGYDEEIIYMAFIRFCNYLNNIPISDEMRRVCGTKPEFLNSGEDLQRQIELLKKEGYEFNSGKMNELLDVVMRKIDINIHNYTISPLQNYQAITQYLYEQYQDPDRDSEQDFNQNNKVLPIQLINMMKEIADENEEYISSSNTIMRSMRNYLAKSNERMVATITDFLKKHTKMSKRELEKKREFLKSMISFDEITSRDDNLMRFVDFSKNTIRNIGSVFPNMIINQVNYEDVKIHLHWNFTDTHIKRLRDFLQGHYVELRRYYGETTLKPLLETMHDKLKNLMLLENAIPIIREDEKTDKEPLFNERTLKMIYTYFILSIFDVIMQLGEDTDLIIQEEVPYAEESDIISSLEAQDAATGQITAVEIIAGDKKSLKDKLASMMSDFLAIVEKDKQAINYNELTIKEKITRSKDLEKDDVVEEFDSLSIEERDVAFVFKKLHMERWGRGKEKGITQYVGDTYDREIEDMERRDMRRSRLSEQEGISGRNIDAAEMEEEERMQRIDEIEAEEYGLEHLPEDDDYGDRDDGYMNEHDPDRDY
jgi:hypothetical protein